MRGSLSWVFLATVEESAGRGLGRLLHEECLFILGSAHTSPALAILYPLLPLTQPTHQATSRPPSMISPITCLNTQWVLGCKCPLLPGGALMPGGFGSEGPLLRRAHLAWAPAFPPGFFLPYTCTVLLLSFMCFCACWQRRKQARR